MLRTWQLPVGALLALSVACSGTGLASTRMEATPVTPAVASPTRPAEVPPTPTPTSDGDDLRVTVDGQPVTSSGLPTPDAYFQELLARHGKDFHTCFAAPTQTSSECPKPASLGSIDLKQQVNVELILDASGSMAERVDGQPKLDAARSVLSKFLTTLPSTANVALRIYGHKGSSDPADKDPSCASSELVSPFQHPDANAFAQSMNSFRPSGWTPLAASLEAARHDFDAFDPSTSTNFVYVVSDGVETCDGDPVEAAHDLHTSNVQPIVNIVGFDLDSEGAQQLQAAAQEGGGQFYQAHDSSELDHLFNYTFNWTEWTRYYDCLYQAATDQYTSTYTAESQSYSCTYQLAQAEHEELAEEANRHYDAIYAAANAAYADAQARDGSDASALGRASQERDTLLDLAGQIRDYAISQEDARTDAILNASAARTSDAIANADLVRQQAIDQIVRDRSGAPAP
jgi:hypothetical protein